MPKQTKPLFSSPILNFPETYPKIAILMILGLAFCLRWPWMGESLWLDEVLATHVHLKNVVFFAATIGPWERMPFYFAWMFAWGKIFGDSEIVLRIPSLLAGLGSIYLVYRVTQLIAAQKTALLAAFFLALSSVHIWYSAEARPYIFGVFLLLASLYSYWKLKDSTRFSKWHATYVVAMFAHVFTHPYLFLFSLFFSFFCFFGETRRKSLFLGLNAAILFVFVAYVLVRTKVFPPIFGLPYLRPFTLVEGWMLYGNWFPTGNTIEPFYPFLFKYRMFLEKPWVFIWQIFFITTSVWGVICIVRGGDQANRERGRELFALLLSLPLFFLTLTYGLNLKQIYLPRNAIFILPYYWIVIAVGVTNLRTGWVRDTMLALSLFLSVLSPVFLFVRQNEWTVHNPKPDMRTAAAYFGDQLDREGPNFVVWSAMSARELTYYDSRLLEQGHSYELRTQIGEYVRLFRHFERFGFLRISNFFEKIFQEDQDIGKAIKKEDFRVREGEEGPSVKDLRREGVRVIYLMVKRHWVSKSRLILGKLQKNEELKFLERKDFKGLEIYKFEISSSGPADPNQSL